MAIAFDWKGQLKGIVASNEQLKKYFDADKAKADEINRVTDVYKMGISPYLAKLLHHESIRKQFVPDIDELTQHDLLSNDPLSEGENTPVARLVHKYPDRAAIFASDFCFAYCRHCTRKNTVLTGLGMITEKEILDIIGYLEKSPEINDVLITGGDPLTLDDSVLENLINRIRLIPHISTIRIGTRAVVSAPMRITEELVGMLRKYHPVWVHVQFNHPAEITSEARQACERLLSAGIPLNNQSVLLKGINDNTETMRELLLALISIRIRPYYLYRCDYVRGTGHFLTEVCTGMDIISALQGTIPGYALPRFVLDTCGIGGKIAVEHSGILYEDDEKLILRGTGGRPQEYKLL